VPHAVVALAVVLLVSACGGAEERRTSGETLSSSDREAAVRLVDNVSDWVNTGEFDRYWGVLHPAHQALISREDFHRCWNQGVLGIASSSELIWVKRVEIDRPGIAQREGVAVRYRRTGKWEDGESYEEDLTRDVVKLDGTWRYLLAEEYVDDLRDGICPVDRSLSIEPGR
jgi:hypothetical protein